MPTKQGKQTLFFDNPPSVVSYAAVGSKKEGEGPLGRHFDAICEDSLFGEATWEKAESRMQKDAVNRALDKASLSPGQIDYIFAGDLLNQCIGSTYGLRDLKIPFLGIFGACSTMAEGLGLASCFIDGGGCSNTVAVTSSHFCTAERQFRFPLEYGGQRTPTSQWTVTGSGAVVVSAASQPPYVRAATFGCMEDLGINDANNMGAAMAPAAAATIRQFLADTLTTPENYDLILTGDLGMVGSKLLLELLERDGIRLGKLHADCGLLIYDRQTQQVEAGGSGCGCAATVLCSYILPRIREGILHNVLFIPTGALMSTTAIQQGETIPGIAHLLWLSDSAG